MPARDVLDAFTQEASRRMAEVVQRYYDVVDQYGPGSTQALVAQSLARIDLERAVRMNHIDAAVIGAGGNLSPEAKGVLNDIVSTDTYYVERFADELPGLSRAQAQVRANMYVSTQRNTIQDITSLELPVLPIYPKDSRLICTWHCKCDLDIRFLFGAGNFDVYWRIDPDGREHCDDCIRLAATWNPLQIRAGRIVNAKMLKPGDLLRLKQAFERLVA